MSTGSAPMRARSAGGVALTIMTVVVVLTAEFGLFAARTVAGVLHTTPVLALIAVLAVTAFWLPYVEVTPGTLVFGNPWRTVTLTWPAVTDLDARFGLKAKTASGTYWAWAAPRESARAAAIAARRAARAARVGATAARDPAAALVVTMLAIQRWESYRDDGLLGQVEGAGVAVRWHRGRIAAAVVLAALTIVSFAV